ncbi:MAG: phospholipid-binding protein MlaC [Dongiaceae bacterium]
MLHRRRFLGLAASLCALVASGRLAIAGTDPAAFIQSLGQQALADLTGSEVTPALRNDRFRALLRQNFDVAAIGKTVLGRYWRIATDEEREEYLKLFEDFLVVNYARRFAEYTGQEFAVKSVRNESDNLVTVFTLVEPPGGGETARLDWLMRSDADSYKILDLKIEGISMSETHRSEFASVIQSSGGKVAGLLDALRNKVGALYPT